MVTIKHTRESIAELEKERNELIKIKNMYNELTDHIRRKAVANPSEHRYFRLVHFIDDLDKERVDG